LYYPPPPPRSQSLYLPHGESRDLTEVAIIANLGNGRYGGRNLFSEKELFYFKDLH
jgi:hypothetical protein